MTRRQLIALAKKAGLGGANRLSTGKLVAALASTTSAAPDELLPSAELPQNYGRTRLTLMEIEPHWAYAYWEVTPHDRQATLDRLGRKDPASQWILRFYEITGLADDVDRNSSFDLSIDLEAGSWYVNLWLGGKSYCAEAGLRSAAGRFIPVCRSNVVNIPSASPSPHYDPRWLRVEGAFEQVEQVPAPESRGICAPAPLEVRECAPPPPIACADPPDAQNPVPALHSVQTGAPISQGTQEEIIPPHAEVPTLGDPADLRPAPSEIGPELRLREAFSSENAGSFGLGMVRIPGCGTATAKISHRSNRGEHFGS